MLIYVLDDGETWTLSEPTALAVTDEQLTRIEQGEKVYNVVPDWDDRPYQPNIERARTHEEDQFIHAGIAAREALKEAKRNYTKNIINAQTMSANTEGK
jgi:hypothetical protein